MSGKRDVIQPSAVSPFRTAAPAVDGFQGFVVLHGGAVSFVRHWSKHNGTPRMHLGLR